MFDQKLAEAGKFFWIHRYGTCHLTLSISCEARFKRGLWKSLGFVFRPQIPEAVHWWNYNLTRKVKKNFVYFLNQSYFASINLCVNYFSHGIYERHLKIWISSCTFCFKVVYITVLINECGVEFFKADSKARFFKQ